MKIVRLFAAALLSPLCLPILFFLAGILFSGYTDECCGHMEKFLFGTASVGVMSYRFSFLLGIPIVLLLRWRSRETMKAYVAISAIVGAVFGYLFAIDHSANYYDVASLAFGCVGAGCGAIVSAVFCLIAGIGWHSRGDVVTKSGASATR